MNIRGIVPSNGLLQYLRCTVSSGTFPRHAKGCIRRQFVREARRSHGGNDGRAGTTSTSATAATVVATIAKSLSGGDSSRSSDDIDSVSDGGGSRRESDNSDSSTSTTQKQRNDSLAFLIGDDPPVISEWDHSNMTTTTTTTTFKPDTTDRTDRTSLSSNKASLDIRGNDISQTATTIDQVSADQVKALNQFWINKCRILMKNHDWVKLNIALDEGKSQNYTFDLRNLEIMTSKLLYHYEYDLVLKVFHNYEDLCVLDRRCISNAIKAAMRSGKYDKCEDIFERYFDKVQSDKNTLETMLSNFVATRNLTVAKAFLYQIWDQAEDYTIKIFMVGVIKIAKNVNDLEEVFDKWRQRQYYKNLIVSPFIYSIALEGFWELNSSEIFKRVYDCAEKDGLRYHPKIEQVLAQIALCRKDFDLFREISCRVANNIGEVESDKDSELSETRNKSPKLARRPFSVAISFLAKQGDINAVEIVVQEMVKHGHKVGSDTINCIIGSLSKLENFPLINYLRSCESQGISGDRNTVDQVFKALIDRYPNIGKLIQLELSKELRSSSSSPISLDPLVKLDRKLKNIHVHSAPNNSSLWTLHEIQKYNLANTPTKGIKLLEDLARRGIVPDRPLFITVIWGLIDAGDKMAGGTDNGGELRSQIEFVLNIMFKSGHEPDIDVEVLSLVLDLNNIKRDKISSFTDKKTRAISLIRAFYNDKNKLLDLRSRTTLAYHMLYWREYYRAIGLFDSLRDGGEFSRKSHDNLSLRGMLKAYRLAQDFQGVVDMVKKLIINDKADIVLHKQFLLELRLCYEDAVKSEHLENADDLLILRKKCEEHNQYQIESSKKMVKEVADILAKWERKNQLQR